MTTTNREEKIKAALEEIRVKHGGKLRPKDVWQYARKNKRSILHGEFEWNVGRAAEKHWEDRARDLIVRFVTVTIVERSHKITAPFYVHDPRLPPKQQGYVAITSSDLNRSDATTIMMAELDRCKASIERARAVSSVLNARHPGINDHLEMLLSEIINLRDALQAAE